MSRTVSMRFGTGSTKSKNSGYVLLWENDSPGSSFSAQDVSVDLSGFSFFGIVVRFSTTYDTRQPMQIYPVDEATKSLNIQATTNNRVGGRDITYSITNKKLTIAGASYNGSANNTYAIPVAIYGINL